MKTAGKLFIILYRLMAAVIVVTAAVILLLMAIGVHPYVVRTGSMEPLIQKGSICLVDRGVAYEEIREGDIIAFKVGDLLVTHRAVRIDDEGITTKGDANNAEDRSPKVTGDRLIGKTIFWIPHVGKLLLYARSGRGRFIAAGVIALFLTGGVIYDRLMAHNKKNREASVTGERDRNSSESDRH